jgi:hypothetical protein
MGMGSHRALDSSDRRVEHECRMPGVRSVMQGEPIIRIGCVPHEPLGRSAQVDRVVFLEKKAGLTIK